MLFGTFNSAYSWALNSLPPKTIAATPYCQDLSKIDHTPQDAVLINAIDRIVIMKSRKKLYLFSKENLVKEYNVVFGFGFLNGAKSQDGDGRTPEGIYSIDLKNPNSNYRKALRISYPNKQDQMFAKQNGVNAGGNIMIHGFPVKPIDGLIPNEVRSIHPNSDWTQGCVGLADDEIDELYKYITVGTVVEICPLDY